jgi:sec-independent protein translocase protein TatC
MALVPFPGPQSGVARLPQDEDDESPGGKMSFLEHLDELRRRIVNACIGIGVGVIIGFFFIERIFNFLLAPARKALPAGATMIYTQPGEAFNLYITVSLIAGVVLAAPFIMYQVWMFIAPGLYSNEKKFAIPFVLFSTLGFLGGAAFNHYVAFPFIMMFFASFNSIDLRFMPKLAEVFGLYTKMLIGIGIVFQMPTVVFFLAKMRVLTASFLLKNFKFAFLLIFIAAAVITPTGDPMTQLIFAAPMVALYGISIVVAWLVGPKRLKDAPV